MVIPLSPAPSQQTASEAWFSVRHTDGFRPRPSAQGLLMYVLSPDAQFPRLLCSAGMTKSSAVRANYSDLWKHPHSHTLCRSSYLVRKPGTSDKSSPRSVATDHPAHRAKFSAIPLEKQTVPHSGWIGGLKRLMMSWAENVWESLSLTQEFPENRAGRGVYSLARADRENALSLHSDWSGRGEDTSHMVDGSLWRLDF